MRTNNFSHCCAGSQYSNNNFISQVVRTRYVELTFIVFRVTNQVFDQQFHGMLFCGAREKTQTARRAPPRNALEIRDKTTRGFLKLERADSSKCLRALRFAPENDRASLLVPTSYLNSFSFLYFFFTHFFYVPIVFVGGWRKSSYLTDKNTFEMRQTSSSFCPDHLHRALSSLSKALTQMPHSYTNKTRAHRLNSKLVPSNSEASPWTHTDSRYRPRTQRDNRLQLLMRPSSTFRRDVWKLSNDTDGATMLIPLIDALYSVVSIFQSVPCVRITNARGVTYPQLPSGI